jgi:hypothetical protein
MPTRVRPSDDPNSSAIKEIRIVPPPQLDMMPSADTAGEKMPTAATPAKDITVAKPPPESESKAVGSQGSAKDEILTGPKGLQHPAPEPPLLAAWRCYLDKRPADALAHLKCYDQVRQDLFLGLISLAAGVTEGDPKRVLPREADVYKDQLNGMSDHLSSKASLRISKLCLCKTIQGYGQYTLMPLNHVYRPDDWVQIYTELQNFTTEAHGEEYTIRPACVYEIIDAQGQVVLHQDVLPVDCQTNSQTPLRDFHKVLSFYLPLKIPPGQYKFRVHLEDLPTGRRVDGEFEFQVGPPLRLVRRGH